MPSPPATVSAVGGRIPYQLHTLGWYGFQRLCLTITREVLGQDVATFLDNHDGGRDGAWGGVWRPGAVGGSPGPYVIQCKHLSKPDRTLAPSRVKDELAKAGRLVSAQQCDRYLLLTNASISASASDRLATAFRAVGVRHFATYGYDWICDTIRDNKRLRMLVPRVYGLGDLSQILDERAYQQATVLLASLQEDLSKVVITDAYDKAARALDQHGFVLIIGEPAAGKTTIAALLAMGAIDQWGTPTAKVHGADQLVRHWNPNEPSQFFWVDDAFGATQYQPALALEWNRSFPELRAAVKNGARIVLTSRDYIYRAARCDLKGSAFPLLEESQVVVDVSTLTMDERRQILYNHLRVGRQPRSFLTAVKPHLESVAGHPRFIPELARRLGDPIFTRGMGCTRDDLLEFVEQPVAFLLDVLQGLDSDSRAALALVFMSGGVLRSPVDLSEAQGNAVERLGSSLGGVTAALTALSNSLVRQVTRDGTPGWIFKHPTIADAFARLVADNSELIDIYLHGASTARLLSEVTCGVAVAGSVVEIPASRYRAFAERLFGEAWPSTRRSVYAFLARRCGSEFLREVIALRPQILADVAAPGLLLDSVPEVPLALTLARHGLMPHDLLDLFRETIVGYAIDGEDLALLDESGLQEIFSENELNDVVKRVRMELVPRAEAVMMKHISSYLAPDTMDERESIAASYLYFLEVLRRHFGGDRMAAGALDDAEQAINGWIQGADDEELPEQPPPLSLQTPTASAPLDSGRSIFDDIDADYADSRGPGAVGITRIPCNE